MELKENLAPAYGHSRSPRASNLGKRKAMADSPGDVTGHKRHKPSGISRNMHQQSSKTAPEGEIPNLRPSLQHTAILDVIPDNSVTNVGQIPLAAKKGLKEAKLLSQDRSSVSGLPSLCNELEYIQSSQTPPLMATLPDVFEVTPQNLSANLTEPLNASPGSPDRLHAFESPNAQFYESGPFWSSQPLIDLDESSPLTPQTSSNVREPASTSTELSSVANSGNPISLAAAPRARHFSDDWPEESVWNGDKEMVYHNAYVVVNEAKRQGEPDAYLTESDGSVDCTTPRRESQVVDESASELSEGDPSPRTMEAEKPDAIRRFEGLVSPRPGMFGGHVDGDIDHE